MPPHLPRRCNVRRLSQPVQCLSPGSSAQAVEIEFGVTKLPHFEVPEGYDSWTYLNKLCHEGLVKRYPDRHEELLPKLDYELNVIWKMGYVDYFLIVWDFINYARTHGIPVGPGRGSAASVPNVTICETQSLPYFFTT